LPAVHTGKRTGRRERNVAGNLPAIVTWLIRESGKRNKYRCCKKVLTHDKSPVSVRYRALGWRPSAHSESAFHRLQ
jgi:hypothetical protein